MRSSRFRRPGKQRIEDVRFAEVEIERPSGRGMIIELEGGLRILVPDGRGVPLAAELINRLWELQAGGSGR